MNITKCDGCGREIHGAKIDRWVVMAKRRWLDFHPDFACFQKWWLASQDEEKQGKDCEDEDDSQ